jgi:hypothetical protein
MDGLLKDKVVVITGGASGAHAVKGCLQILRNSICKQAELVKSLNFHGHPAPHASRRQQTSLLTCARCPQESAVHAPGCFWRVAPGW